MQNFFNLSAKPPQISLLPQWNLGALMKAALIDSAKQSSWKSCCQFSHGSSLIPCLPEHLLCVQHTSGNPNNELKEERRVSSHCYKEWLCHAAELAYSFSRHISETGCKDQAPSPSLQHCAPTAIDDGARHSTLWGCSEGTSPATLTLLDRACLPPQEN